MTMGMMIMCVFVFNLGLSHPNWNPNILYVGGKDDKWFCLV